jgi:hypothetical protein
LISSTLAVILAFAASSFAFSLSAMGFVSFLPSASTFA